MNGTLKTTMLCLVNTYFSQSLQNSHISTAGWLNLGIANETAYLVFIRQSNWNNFQFWDCINYYRIPNYYITWISPQQWPPKWFFEHFLRKAFFSSFSLQLVLKNLVSIFQSHFKGDVSQPIYSFMSTNVKLNVGLPIETFSVQPYRTLKHAISKVT